MPVEEVRPNALDAAIEEAQCLQDLQSVKEEQLTLEGIERHAADCCQNRFIIGE